MTLSWKDRHNQRHTDQTTVNGAHILPLPTPPTLNGHRREDTDAYAHTALERETAAVATAPEGTRNHTLNVAAFNLGQLVAAGALQPRQVEQALTTAAQSAGLPIAEIRRTIASGLKGGYRSGPRRIAEQPGSFSLTETTIDQLTGEITERKIDFWEARPALRHIRDFARGRMAAPWGTLGAVLVRVIASTPWTIRLPPIVGGLASLNMTVAITAPSGGGKGAAESAAKEAFNWPRIHEYRIGSGEAIAHCLKHRLPANKGGGTEWNDHSHSALISMSEVDKLAGQAARHGSTIMAELRAAWSGESLGHITADQTRRIPVNAHTYRLALILGVQPLRAGFLLDDADGGFPQRVVWLPATDPNSPDTDGQTPLPLDWRPPDIRQFEQLDRPIIHVCEQAEMEIRAARHNGLRGIGDPLDGHKLHAQEKVAAALAILDSRYAINDEDWQLARIVMHMSDLTRTQAQAAISARHEQIEKTRSTTAAKRAAAASEAVADAAVQRVCRNLLRHVQLAGTIGWNDLAKKLASRDKDQFEDAIARLVEAGQIIVVDQPDGRSPDGVARTVQAVPS